MNAKITKSTLADGRTWPAAPSEIGEFHRKMPAFSPTLLLDAPEIAKELGVGRVLVKAETRRMGLPSFKILGASWATYKAVCAHVGEEPAPWRNINELAARWAHLRPFTLATATDGNHGRAVSFMARLLGFQAKIFVPTGMAAPRIAAMEAEGATVTVVDGDYDDAVARAGQEASEHCVIVSDTSWEGYETIPTQVIEGYETIFNEVDEAIDASHLPHPDMVFVPMGVGAFMAAAVTHYRSGEQRPVIVGVEPLDANCVQESAIAGELAHVPGPHRSIMVGLNCGMPSMIAWPRLSTGIDWYVSVDDDKARDGMRSLADAGVAAGETGAAALAGASAFFADSEAISAFPDRATSTILLMVCEGATDPEAFEEIVGRPHDSIGRVLTAIR